MNDNVIKKSPRMISSNAENDCLDETFLYENALKNLQREIEEKQKIISRLQIKANPVQSPQTIDIDHIDKDDEYYYLKNRNAMQRIKDDAADILIGELKSITSNLKRKLNDIDEKEKKISSRLIELEERQAILEEIDYVQRMIPKKILNDSISKSVETKQDLDIDIEGMFKPAVNVITQKTENKLPQKVDFKIIKEKNILPKEQIKEATTEIKKVNDQNINNEVVAYDEVIIQTESVSTPEDTIAVNKCNDKKTKETKQIKVSKEIKEPEYKDRPVNKAQEKKHTVNKSTTEHKLTEIKHLIDENQQKEVKPKPEEIKKVVIKDKTNKDSSPINLNAVIRDAKNKKSYTSKPERKGLYTQQRNWKNFAYIKDSKVKLKQNDLQEIQKNIMDIEQGKLSAKGI